jgi:hypothetical protein
MPIEAADFTGRPGRRPRALGRRQRLRAGGDEQVKDNTPGEEASHGQHDPGDNEEATTGGNYGRRWRARSVSDWSALYSGR